MTATNSRTKYGLVKGALMTGMVNAVINAGIQYFLLKGEVSVPITVDTITNNVKTVLGATVPLAISLAMILTVVSFYKILDRRIKFFPYVFWMVLKHGFFTFGVVTALAVVWQRVFGSLEVSLFPALLIIGAVAGAVSSAIEYLTIRTCISRELLAVPTLVE